MSISYEELVEMEVQSQVFEQGLFTEEEQDLIDEFYDEYNSDLQEDINFLDEEEQFEAYRSNKAEFYDKLSNDILELMYEKANDNSISEEDRKQYKLIADTIKSVDDDFEDCYNYEM
ncbi:hypothetical protein DVV95_11070 [Clostridium botulinum]|uniref:hypothetical protein n=1 Tax=Clostridium botulinum TaxID=1491 RepID=UPI000A1780D7|nr:hypothetical protein [Clostridium botulinum]MBN1062354.1 hypothetical protein [Clostridium botulinum]